MGNKDRYQIIPSLLSADILNLKCEVSNIIKAKADMLHVDVMDNHYVPNLTFGPLICEALGLEFPNLPLDVHLMASPTDELIMQFAKAKVSRISIHPDATTHLDRSLGLIKQLGCEAGIALNPASSPEAIKWCINKLDFVLVMTVNPGFGGQDLIKEVIPKIDFIHKEYPELLIVVDGGINIDNINLLAMAGARGFVAGSAIFNSENYIDTINQMRRQIKNL